MVKLIISMLPNLETLKSRAFPSHHSLPKARPRKLQPSKWKKYQTKKPRCRFRAMSKFMDKTITINRTWGSARCCCSDICSDRILITCRPGITAIIHLTTDRTEVSVIIHIPAGPAVCMALVVFDQAPPVTYLPLLNRQMPARRQIKLRRRFTGQPSPSAVFKPVAGQRPDVAEVLGAAVRAPHGAGHPVGVVASAPESNLDCLKSI